MSYCNFCLQKLNRFHSLYTCRCEGKDGVYQIHWTCDEIRKKKYNSPDCADCDEKLVLCNDGVHFEEHVSAMCMFVTFALMTFFLKIVVRPMDECTIGAYWCDFSKLMYSILTMGTVLSLAWMIVDFAYFVSALVVFYTL